MQVTGQLMSPTNWGYNICVPDEELGNREGSACIIDPDNLKEMLGVRYDTDLSPVQNLINAIPEFPPDISIVLENFEFELPEYSLRHAVILPENIILTSSCKVISGSLGFFNGTVLADGPTTVIYAAGSNCHVILNVEGATVFLTSPEGVTVQQAVDGVSVYSFDDVQLLVNVLTLWADKDNLDAAYHVGIMGTCGLFSAMCTYESGEAYLHLAAIQGHVGANYLLGLMNLHPRDDSDDKHLFHARAYFCRAHNLGDLESTFMLAEVCSHPDFCQNQFFFNGEFKTGAEIGYQLYKIAAIKNHARAIEKVNCVFPY